MPEVQKRGDRAVVLEVRGRWLPGDRHRQQAFRTTTSKLGLASKHWSHKTAHTELSRARNARRIERRSGCPVRHLRESLGLWDAWQLGPRCRVSVKHGRRAPIPGRILRLHRASGLRLHRHPDRDCTGHPGPFEGICDDARRGERIQDQCPSKEPARRKEEAYRSGAFMFQTLLVNLDCGSSYSLSYIDFIVSRDMRRAYREPVLR